MTSTLTLSCSIPAEFIDTKYPTHKSGHRQQEGADRDYSTLKFQMCQISKEYVAFDKV